MIGDTEQFQLHSSVKCERVTPSLLSTVDEIVTQQPKPESLVSLTANLFQISLFDELPFRRCQALQNLSVGCTKEAGRGVDGVLNAQQLLEVVFVFCDAFHL